MPPMAKLRLLRIVEGGLPWIICGSPKFCDKRPHKDLLARVRQKETWQKGRGNHKSRDGRELRNAHPHPQKLGEPKSGLFP